MNVEFASRQITTHLAATDVIEFTIGETASITLNILDENGKSVEQIVESMQFSPGIHQIRFDCSKYSDGVYYYRLSATTAVGEIIDTKKIVFLGKMGTKINSKP